MLPRLVCLLIAAALVAAAPPPRTDKEVKKRIREVAGSAEYLRSLPKQFAIYKGIDRTTGNLSLLMDGDKQPTSYPLMTAAEIKIDGWWGRIDQVPVGEHVWVWLKTNRQKKPVAVAMLADDLSTQDIRGSGQKVIENKKGSIVLKPEKGKNRTLKTDKAEAFQGSKKVSPEAFKAGSMVFVKSAGDGATLLLDKEGFEKRRQDQRQALRKRWLSAGLPGTLGVVHVFSGEVDLLIDHEGMRWARSLKRGDKVTLVDIPAIKAVVKSVSPWREHTQLRLVARAQDLSDLKAGQRLGLKMTPPSAEVENSKFPPDMDRPRTRSERIDWFLASIYCTCGVRGDTCTGHFYTLASCNPNGCGQPNAMRKTIGQLIDKNMSDRQIFEKLLKEQGPGLLQPHLLP